MKSKEQLYKQYLETELTEYDFVLKLDLLKAKDIKKSGIVYTPYNIVQEMIKLSQIKITDKIIEPSCGHGMFIFGLLNEMAKVLDKGNELLHWFKSNITGIEIEPETVIELKESLALYFKKNFQINKDPSYFDNIINEDSLSHHSNIEYDICIGNPPYVRTKNIESIYLKKLREDFVTCKKGNIDIYYAFIEKYTNSCKKVCFIVPNTCLRNESAKSLRAFLIDKIGCLIDFKEELIFDHARIYTCILLASKYKKTNEIKYKNSLSENFKNISSQDLFKIKTTPKTDYIIYSSMATLCDSSYMAYEKEGKYYAYYNEKEYEIEKEILIPYIKITKQKQHEVFYNYIIYPYDNDKKTINEFFLKEKYPKTYQYFLDIKDTIFIKRDKGKIEKYEQWYSYGRKQGIYDFVSGDVVCVPLMIGGNCIPKKLDISDFVSKYNRILFTSGFIIPCVPENKSLCNFVLSDDFREYIKEYAKKLPGKDAPYYNINVKLLRELIFE